MSARFYSARRWFGRLCPGENCHAPDSWARRAQFEHARYLPPGRRRQKSGSAEFSHGENNEFRFNVRCPFGEVGDHLWVRESWQVSAKYDAVPPRDIPWERGVSTYFAAGGSRAHDASGAYVNEDTICVPDWVGRMRPSIHIPRLASRITLEITAVRVERLQDISEEQCAAEGVRATRDDSGTLVGREGPGKYITPWLTRKEAFRDIWESVGGDWYANPWVWAVEFKVVQ